VSQADGEVATDPITCTRYDRNTVK
jgi:hypothetical protein